MTTEMKTETEDKKDDAVDITDALAAIESRLTEKMSTGLSSIEKKLKTEEPPAEDSWAEEDGYLSKTDLPKVSEQISSQVEKRLAERNEVMAKKQRRDFQAVNEFPEMNPQHPAFNKRFHAEVAKEIEARVNNGRKADDMDLLYDCAAAVNARGMREKWHIPRSQVDTDRTRMNRGDDSFDVRGTPPSRGAPTEGTMAFARRLGMSDERAKQVLEIRAKKR